MDLYAKSQYTGLLPLVERLRIYYWQYNRPYKNPIITAFCWGRNARYASGLEIGDNIKIWGRIQSREYQKKQENGDVITKVAYEVSVSKMEVLSSEKDIPSPDEDDA